MEDVLNHLNEENNDFPGGKDYHGINSMRLAEVWLDDYKSLFYGYRKDLLVSPHKRDIETYHFRIATSSV